MGKKEYFIWLLNYYTQKCMSVFLLKETDYGHLGDNLDRFHQTIYFRYNIDH